MKKVFTVLLVFISFCTVLKSQTNQNSVADVILSGYSSKVFTSAPVSDKDIDLILQCGIKAPSGMNSQPWKFTVVKTSELINGIQQNITPGNVLIVISGLVKADGTTDQFSVGLAVQNMYIAAQGLGLGTHIYMSPVAGVNTNFKDKLGIPADYKALAILRVGNIEKTADAASGASTRKQFEEIVTVR